MSFREYTKYIFIKAAPNLKKLILKSIIPCSYVNWTIFFYVYLLIISVYHLYLFIFNLFVTIKHVDVLTYNYFNLMNGFKIKSYLYYALNT